MMTFANNGPLHLREFARDDLLGLVSLLNAEYPDEPASLEQEQHWDAIYPKTNPRRRLAVEAADGQLVAFGVVEDSSFWQKAEGVYHFYAIVDGSWRRQGIARALLAELEPYARDKGATRLWTEARESQGHTLAWLSRAGFHQFGYRFESAVDLETFDAGRFAGAADRAIAAGYTFSTLAEQRQVRDDADRALFELSGVGMADCPLPGGAIITLQWEVWREALSAPTFDPGFVFIALQGSDMVAMTRMELPANSPAFTSDTCVLREHRGRGLATALKVRSLGALRARGYKESRTHNDTANPSIVHINEKLGYKRIPGWTEWEKPL